MRNQGENDCLALLVVTAPTSTSESICNHFPQRLTSPREAHSVEHDRSITNIPHGQHLSKCHEQRSTQSRLRTSSLRMINHDCLRNPTPLAQEECTLTMNDRYSNASPRRFAAKDTRSRFEQENLFARYRFILQTKRGELALATTNTRTDVRKGRFKTTNLR